MAQIIDVERPNIDIALRLEDGRELEFRFCTDSRSAYKSLADAVSQLQESEARYKRTLDSSKGESAEQIALAFFQFGQMQAQICIDAIKSALEPQEFAKIADIVEYLPFKTLEKILVACANAVSEQTVKAYAEGKV